MPSLTTLTWVLLIIVLLSTIVGIVITLYMRWCDSQERLHTARQLRRESVEREVQL